MGAELRWLVRADGSKTLQARDCPAGIPWQDVPIVAEVLSIAERQRRYASGGYRTPKATGVPNPALDDLVVYAQTRGEPAAGIAPAFFELNLGGFVFDQRTEREEFRQRFHNLFFGLLGESAQVWFSDER